MQTKKQQASFFKLKEICHIGGGNSKLTKKYLKKHSGIYPVYANSKDNIPQGYWNSYAYDLKEVIYFISVSSKKIVGKFFYLKNQKFSLYSQAKILINFRKDLNLRYLYLYLIQIEIQYYLVAIKSIKSHINQLRNLEAYDLDIFLPSISIQNSFVNLLWFLEEDFKSLKIKITNLKKQLKEFKRQVLRYCFSFYFNVKNNPNLKLETKLIKDVCLINHGDSKLNKKYCLQNPGIYPVYSSETVGEHTFAKINKHQYDGTYIWYTHYGYVGNFYYEENNKFSLTYAGSLIKLKKEFLGSLNLKYFFYYLWKEQKNIKYLLTTGAAIPRLNREDLKNYSIIIPDLKTQEQIIEFLSCYDYIDNIILKLDNFLNSYAGYKITILRILLVVLEQFS